jgi:hypothetical protein
MSKKLTLTIFMLICALSASISAQTAASSEKQTAIKELVFLINGDNKMEEMMNVMASQMQASQDTTAKAMLDERTDLTVTERQALEDALISDKKYSYKRFHDKFIQKFNYTELMNEISYAAFDKYYTLEEIKELTAFYKTPTGKKSIKMATAIAADTMQTVQERLMPKMMIVIEEIQEEDKAEMEQKINAKKPRPKKNAGK